MNKVKNRGEAYKADPDYEENWVDRYFREYGLAWSDARQHEAELKNAINMYVGEEKKRRPYRAAVVASNMMNMTYSNPTSRVNWCQALSRQCLKSLPKPPVYKVILRVDGFDHLNTSRRFFIAALHSMVGLGEFTFRKAEVSVLGHAFSRIYPGLKNGGYRVDTYLQFLAWSCTKEQLKTLLSRAYPKLKDGTIGCEIEELRDPFCKALSECTKTIPEGDSRCDVGDGLTYWKPLHLPPRAHFQLLCGTMLVTWTDACFALGEGVQIRDAALQNLKPNFLGQAVPGGTTDVKTDKEKPPARSQKDVPDKLTIESDIADDLQAHTANADLAQQAQEAGAAFIEYEAQDKKGTELLFEFLRHVYQLGLSSQVRTDELRILVQERGLPQNKRTDLFGLAIRIALDRKPVDRRRVSEWAGALRYLYQQRCAPTDVVPRLRELGLRDTAKLAAAQEKGETERVAAKPKVPRPRSTAAAMRERQRLDFIQPHERATQRAKQLRQRSEQQPTHDDVDAVGYPAASSDLDEIDLREPEPAVESATVRFANFGSVQPLPGSQDEYLARVRIDDQGNATHGELLTLYRTFKIVIKAKIIIDRAKRKRFEERTRRRKLRQDARLSFLKSYEWLQKSLRRQMREREAGEAD